MTLQPVLRRTHRALPFVLLAPLLPTRRLPERPVFVIGCPRSGTSVTFHLMRRLPGFTSIRTEGDVLWETFHHPRQRGWASSSLDAGDAGEIDRRFLSWTIPTLAGRGRFVDKTARNCLRLPYLDALFPDATYVFIVRDGRATVSSLIRQWRARTRPSHVLPQPFTIPGIRPRWWHFTLPPGWREFNGRALEEVCAHQYVTALDAILAFRAQLSPQRSYQLRFEALVQDPIAEVRRLHDWFDVPFGDADAIAVRQTVRNPGRRTWATETPREIDRILPTIAPVMERTGYQI